MKHQKKNSVAALLGASVVTSLTVGVVNAAENPFALKDLSSGYQLAEGEQAPKAKEGEGKCGAEMMKKDSEMKCGASMMPGMKSAEPTKAMEGKCAGMKMDAAPTPAPSK
jgi:uncharacterized low-complexity protein